MTRERIAIASLFEQAALDASEPLVNRLDALASSHLKVLTTSWRLDGDMSTPEFTDMIQRAIDLDLTALILREGSHSATAIFSAFEDVWRSLACAWITRRASVSWSDMLERMVLELKGWKSSEIDRRLASIKARRASWLGITVYFVIENREQGVLDDLGWRSLASDLLPRRLFYHRGNFVVSRSAYGRLTSRRLRLCRFSIAVDTFLSLFGTGSRGVARYTVGNASQQRVINCAMASQIQVLARRGWE